MRKHFTYYSLISCAAAHTLFSKVKCASILLIITHNMPLSKIFIKILEVSYRSISATRPVDLCSLIMPSISFKSVDSRSPGIVFFNALVALPYSSALW